MSHPLQILKSRRDEHSEVGASGRQRWRICPGSVRLVRLAPQGPQSEYAAWGQKAHDHGEEGLRYLFIPGSPKPGKIADPEMRECVVAYLEHVGRLIEKHFKGHSFRVWIEERFTLPGFEGAAYGRVDFAAYCPELQLLLVVDLKTGGGVMVSAVENPQALYYATALMFQEHLPVKSAVLAISMPRGSEDYRETEWEVTGSRLYEELGTLNREIEATGALDAPLVAGDHCAKSFCPVRATCPAYRQESYALAVSDFAPVATYDVERLVKLYLASDRIEDHLKAVSHFLHAEANAGRVPPGLKLVNKRLGDRKWKDETRAGELLVLQPRGEQFFKTKLVSPAQAEKIVGKHDWFDPTAADSLVVRESTGTTLVEESDKRPPASLALEFGPVKTQKEG